MAKLTDEAAFERLIAPKPDGHGYTKKQLGEMVGISKQAVTRWKAVPTRYVLALSKATGISKAKLLPSLFG